MNCSCILKHRRFVLPFCVFALLTATAGCPKGAKNVVEGKVIYKGQKVDGKVVFHGSDGKKADGLIDPAGIYHVPDAPIGDCKITVEGMGGGGPLGGSPKSAEVPKPKDKQKSGGGGVDVPAPMAMGLAPPAKYKDPNTTDLRYTVKGGKEKFDIELK